MARACEICGKKAMSGHNVSHSHKKTKRTFKPNLQRVKVNLNGTIKRVLVCAECLRSNKIQKVV